MEEKRESPKLQHFILSFLVVFALRQLGAPWWFSTPMAGVVVFLYIIVQIWDAEDKEDKDQ